MPGDQYTKNSATTLYAIWDKNSYTVTFDPDGGTVSPTSKEVTYDDLYGELPTPTKEGYGFSGWYTQRNGQGEEITSSSTVKITENQTLYAKWTQGYYVVKHYKQNIDGTYPTIATDEENKTATPGEEVTPETKDVTTGSYLGFKAPAKQTVTVAEDGSTVVEYKYERNSYTLTINPNGGKWNNLTTNSEITKVFEDQTEVENPVAPEGYTVTFNTNEGSIVNSITSSKSFAGWSKTGSGSINGTTYTFGAGNATLTANYNNNAIELPETAKEGYTFNGWYDTNGNKIGNAGENYTPTSNIELVANWLVNKYTVTFSASKGTLNTGTKEVTYGQNYGDLAILSNSYTVTYNYNYTGSTNESVTANSTLDGWYKESTFINKVESTSQVTEAKDHTLYAKIIDETITLKTPTRTGYTFGGWYDSATGGNKVGTSEGKYTPNSNITLYAHWTANTDTKYVVKHYKQNINQDGYNLAETENDLKGTTDEEVTPAVKTYEGFTSPTTQTVKINADGSTVVKYYYTRKTSTLTINPNGGKWNNSSENSNITKTYENTQIIANPTAPEGYVVTFDANTGTCDTTSITSTKSFTSWSQTGGGSLEDNTYTFGIADGTLTANYKNNEITLPEARKTGYAFIGWYDAKTNGNLVGNAGDKYIPNENKTLYARYSASLVNYTVNHYLENADNTNYTLYKTESNKQANADSNIAVSSTTISISNATYSKSSKNGGTAGPGTVVTEVTVKSDGTTVINNFYTRNKFTLTLDKNENISAVTGSGSYKWGATVLIDATLAEITGYTTSWNKWVSSNSSLVADQLTQKATITMPTSAITLTANGNKTPISYTVKYDGNGATSGSTASSSHVYDTSKKLTANGYERKYTVSFNSNGGSSVEDMVSSYTFENWNTVKDGTGTSYEDMEEVKNLASTNGKTVILYAKWTENSIKLPTSTKQGWAIEGWYLDEALTTKVGNAGANYIPTSDITLYANWTEGGASYTVNHYKQNVDETYPKAPTETEIGSATTNSDITPEVKSYIGFTSPSTQTVKVAEDGTTVVNYYYTRNSYTLTLEKQDEISSVSGGGTYKYEQSVDISATLQEKVGYLATFTRWESSNTSLLGNQTSKDTTIIMPAGNVTLTATAIQTAKQYTVNFETNGGSSVSSKTVTYDETYGALSESTKEGHTFAGWYKENTFVNKVESTTTVTTASNHTLYAKWNVNQYTLTVNPGGTKTVQNYGTTKEVTAPANPTYTISYNTNGGTSVTSSTATRPFTNWTLEGKGSISSTTSNPTTYTFGAGDGTLTAKYNETANEITLPSTSREFTITYNANGGTVSKTSETVSDTFEGWYNDEGLTNLAGIAGASYLANANTTLYAKWTENTLELLTPTWEGHTFIGWYDAMVGGNKIGDALQNYNPSSNITLYAHWTVNSYTLTVNPGGTQTTQDYGTTKEVTAPANPTYTISYNTNGGTSVTSNTATRPFTNWTLEGKGSISSEIANPTTYTFGAGDGTLTANYNKTANAITLPSTSKEFTITYNADGGTISKTEETVSDTFEGWYKEEILSNLAGKAGASYLANANTTLYAKWTEGTTTLPTASRAGYTFEGWYNESGTNVGKNGEIYNPSSNVTLTAKWTQNKYTITLDSQGATTEGTSSIYEKYESGIYLDSNLTNKMTTSSNKIEVPSKTYRVTYDANEGICNTSYDDISYTFGGYYSQNAGKGTKLISSNGYITSDFTSTYYLANSTIYAKWTSNSVTLPEPTRTGYTFDGWYDAKTGGNKITSPYTAVANITLYAHWTANDVNYTVYHYLENANNTNYTLYGEEQILTAKADSTITISNLKIDIANSTYVGGNITGETTGVGTSLTTTTVSPDGSTKIYLYYTRNTFELTLNKNEYISKVTGAGTYKWGASVPITATIGTKTGYDLSWVNWTSSNTTLLADQSTQNVTIKMPAGAITLTANGKQTAKKYTVTFNPQGGTITNNTQEVTYNETYGSLPEVRGDEGLKAKSYTLTYNYNYTGKSNSVNTIRCSLEGWYKETGYTNKITSTTVVNTASDHTLYAKWNNPSVTLETPTRAGYTFAGWYKEEALTNFVANGGASYELSTNTIIYAKWTPNTDTKYTVVHKKMNLDGTYPTENTAVSGKVEVVEGSGTTGTSVTPQTKTYTGFTAPQTQTVTINGDGTTVVIYEYSRNKYTFTLGTTTGASTTGSTKTGEYYYETQITLNASANTGYTWSTWTSSNTSLQANISAKNSSFKMPAGNVTMTPTVTANTYTISYNGNGATGGSTASSDHVYDITKELTANGYERKYTVTFNNNYEGSTNEVLTSTYTFKNWNTVAGGTGTTYTDKQSVINLSSENGATVNLYAQWDNSNAGVTITEPTRKNYVFDGWYDTETGGNKITLPYTPTKNTTLYAHWVEANCSVTTTKGTYYYLSLAEAVAKADNSGSTITILNDYTDKSAVTIGKSLTLNTNGKTLSRTDVITINGENTVTIRGNGKITSQSSVIYSKDGATVNIGSSSEDLSATSPVIESTSDYGINLSNTESKLNFYNGVIKGTSKTTHNGVDVAFNAAGTVTYRSGYGAATTLSDSIYSTILTTINMEVSPTEVYLNTGDNNTKQLSISGNYVGTKTYTSNNTNIASVDGNGLITALSAGTCTITVKEANGGATATCKVIVDDTLPIWTITVDSVE